MENQSSPHSLHHVDDYERNVVLLGSGSRLPVAYLGEQFIRQFRRWTTLIVPNNLLKPCVTEGIAVGILGFSYAVGAKQEAVAWIDRHRTNLIFIALQVHSEMQTVSLDTLQLDSPTSQERGMSSC
jgi:hypothetical protein